MARKKKRSTLPRVTVLAFNRKELAAFAAAVEELALHVADLRILLAEKKKAKKLPTSPPPVEEKGGAS